MAKRARASGVRSENLSRPLGTSVSYEALNAQIDKARRHHTAAREAGHVAVGARFDRKSRRVIVEMSSGFAFGIPVAAMPELRQAADAQIARVTVDELGSGLLWDELDVHVGVIGILLEAIGDRVIRAAASRSAGMVVTEAKSAAARRNGAKGGRPRKYPK